MKHKLGNYSSFNEKKKKEIEEIKDRNWKIEIGLIWF